MARESSVRASMVALGEADIAPNIAIQDANRPDLDFSYLNPETTVLLIGQEELLERPARENGAQLCVNRNAIRAVF